MTTTTTTNIQITDVREADEIRVFTAAEFKMDKRTREYKNLVELTNKVGEYYTITTGYYANPDYPINEWSSKYFLLELKDEAAAANLLTQALELGLFTYGVDPKQAIFIPVKAVIYADSSDILSHHDTLVDMMVSVEGFTPNESTWENRKVAEYGKPTMLAKIEAAIAMRQLEAKKKAAMEQELAAAEEAIPTTYDIKQAIRYATQTIERNRAATNEVNHRADSYKEVAVKLAVAEMCVRFNYHCGSLTKNDDNTYRRITVGEAFGLVVAYACNDSWVCPSEIFAEAVTEFRRAVAFF